MSKQELRRVEVLTEVLAGSRTTESAAGVLGVSLRQAQRLISRYRDGGGGALIHKSRGRPASNLMAGDSSAAVREDQAALAADPLDSVAAGDMAVLLARSRHLDEAVRLWRMVAVNDPGETAAGMNLAIGSCMMGDTAAAIRALERVIDFSPNDAKAKGLLAQLRSGSQPCGAK